MPCSGWVMIPGYELFCKTAIDFDEQLAALGAKRLHARADLDVDYAARPPAGLTTAVSAFAPELNKANGFCAGYCLARRNSYRWS